MQRKIALWFVLLIVFKDTTRVIPGKAPITSNRIRMTRRCLLD